MGILDRFRKKKKGEEKPIEKPKKVKEEITQKETIIDLETVCSDDKEAYKALYDTMFLDPRKLRVSMKEAEEKAKKFEESGDILGAVAQYEIAGGLAIWKGDVARIKQHFGKCKELSPNKDYKILEIPERAVKKAQEYYKYLKEEEKK